MASRVVVADASPLIGLARIGSLPLLGDLFDEVLLPEAVAAECIRETHRPGATAIASAITDGALLVCAVEQGPAVRALAEVLDDGEAEALALALERDVPVLMDERRGRRVAARRGVAVVGTGAVLVAAKRGGLVPAVAPLLEALRDSGYRLSDELTRGILSRCGEAG